LETADRNGCMDAYPALGDSIPVLIPDFTVFYNDTVILIYMRKSDMLPF